MRSWRNGLSGDAQMIRFLMCFTGLIVWGLLIAQGLVEVDVSKLQGKKSDPGEHMAPVKSVDMNGNVIKDFDWNKARDPFQRIR